MFNNAEDPCQFSINHSTAESLMNLVNGFLIAVTCRGNIVIVTPSIEQHLGHCQVNDILIKSFQFVYLFLLMVLGIL